MASSWSWVTKMVVMPKSCWMRRISTWRLRRSFASMALRGSSSSSTLGSVTIARARATRCCWPPESWLGYWSALSSRPTMVSISPTLRVTMSLGTFFMFRPKATFWATLMLGKRLYCWNTMPMPRSRGLTWVISLPSRLMVPLVTSSRPARHRSRVLLPQPEGPSSVTRCPFSISMVMPFRTLFCPKSLWMS